MRPLHIALAVLLAAVWGFNFVVTKAGLSGYPPMLLNALRFAVAALPAFMLPRPHLPWRRLAAIAGTLFFGQFAFLLSAMKAGLSAGLASVVLQSQAFFTLAIAAAVLGERPTPRQGLGMATALAGLFLIGTTIGDAHGDMTGLGFILCLCAAACWATGNVLLRGQPVTDTLALMVWLSALMPLPFLGASLLIDGYDALAHALAATDLMRIGAVLYLSLASTLFGYGLWGHFLRLYPATSVTPFALLVPVFGMASSALVYDETFGLARLTAAALIIAGVGIVVMPAPRR